MTDVAAIHPLGGQAGAGWAGLLHALVRLNGGELPRTVSEVAVPRLEDHVELRFSRLPLGVNPRAANASSLAVELLASAAPGSPAFGEQAYRRLIMPEAVAPHAGGTARPADAAEESRAAWRNPTPQPPPAESGQGDPPLANRLDLPGPSAQYRRVLGRPFPTRAIRLKPVAPAGPWRLMARRSAAAFAGVLVKYPLLGLMTAWFLLGLGIGVLAPILPFVRGSLAAWGLGLLVLVVLGFLGSSRSAWRSQPPLMRR